MNQRFLKNQKRFDTYVFIPRIALEKASREKQVLFFISISATKYIDHNAMPLEERRHSG
jgi:hypothetical protein